MKTEKRRGKIKLFDREGGNKHSAVAAEMPGCQPEVR